MKAKTKEMGNARQKARPIKCVINENHRDFFDLAVVLGVSPSLVVAVGEL